MVEATGTGVYGCCLGARVLARLLSVKMGFKICVVWAHGHEHRLRMGVLVFRWILFESKGLNMGALLEHGF